MSKNICLTASPVLDGSFLSDRFKEYYSFLQSEFGKYNYTLTGMGTNPYRIYNKNIPLDEHEELLCCRDMFWENSTHGNNPHNIGMYDCEFKTADDVLTYIQSTSIYCVERDNKYINFPPSTQRYTKQKHKTKNSSKIVDNCIFYPYNRINN